jgi:hypothetical protein
MKKILCLMLACILCGSLVFTACTNESTKKDSEATQSEAASGEVTQTDIDEKIIGKWILADKDGEPQPTNKKYVIDFISDSRAYVSASLNWSPEAGSFWDPNIEPDVSINGNNVMLTANYDGNRTSEDVYTLTAINDNTFTANRKGTLIQDGTEVFTDEKIVTFVKINDDYSEDIIGTWEGHCTSEGSVFDDGQEHRWEYKADGTYVYYDKDGDDWVPRDDTLSEYFVAGNLLCTRWVADEENREWWEITIDGDKMNWTALREGDDGKTYTATFEMNKVEK